MAEEINSDEQTIEWEKLYGQIVLWLQKFGADNAFGDADFWVLDDNWGPNQQKVYVNALAMLEPKIVAGLRNLLRDFPKWEIVVAVAVSGAGNDWPNMGLTIRASEIIDGLQRSYFPAEFQSFYYEGSKRGTERD